jgi:adenine-specific DNA-methyltransferase
MGANITYMGTKRALAPAVADVIKSAQPGTLLDCFSGMCSVGEAVGEARQIWNNDKQIFASKVAEALFLSRKPPPSPLTCADIHYEGFVAQRGILDRAFQNSVVCEEALLKASSFTALESGLSRLRSALEADTSNCRLRSPHLFVSTYGNTYFGVRQSIDADAIIAAIRSARKKTRSSRDDARWATVALGRALLKISNSTGHFAQFLKPKPGNYKRFLALRRRLLWKEWLESLTMLSPVGHLEWRKRNRVFNEDSLSLIPRLVRQKADVSVVYADPPYTDDQYSRFYHLLETMCLYDYPSVSGLGLYRTARFQTPFSIKTRTVVALQRFIETCSKTGADLVLSYPANGLAVDAGADIRAMLKRHFRNVEVSCQMEHVHSTFGASKGPALAAATELIYLARSA